MRRAAIFFALAVASFATRPPLASAQAPGTAQAPAPPIAGRIRTLEELRAAAEKGDAEAQFTLGGM
jgi:hypothetical protein